MTDWFHQVADYLVRLETTLDTLQTSLQTIRTQTRDGRYGEIEPASESLVEALRQLEQLLGDRQTLLEDPQAPSRQRTLQAVLRQCTSVSEQGGGGNDPPRAAHDEASDAASDDASVLLDQCLMLSARMERLREETVALFVCQYHLSETAERFLQIMFPQIDATAGMGGSQTQRRGGRLLDQAG
jgi:hypothetical protein